MNKVAKISMGTVSFLAIIAVALYVDMRLGTKADRDACPNLKESQVADAVIHDVIRPDNKMFAHHHLTAEDVHIQMDGIQIGPLIAYVPFTISESPNVVYAGMPRCSDLKDIEYGN